jgi:hypothetical protein
MKLPSREELHDYTVAVSIGAAKGSAIGAAFSSGLTYYLLKYHPTFRSRGAYIRTMTFMAPVLAVGMTSMEFASRKFEQERYGIGAEEARIAKSKYAGMSLGEQVRTHLVEHKYKYIMGAWAGCMGGSYYLINRDKYMTKAQKIVQARMYAQGLTVLLLIGSMALTGVSNEKEREKELEESRHSWERVIEMEQAKAKEHKKPANAEASA